MSVDVVMPQMGESITEGTVSKWLKKLGDRIEKDEPILEISTDKVDAEVPSPGAGILLAINTQEGETVEVGTVVAVIGDAAESSVSRKQEAGSSQPEVAQTATVAAEPPPAPVAVTAPSSALHTSNSTEIVMPQMGESITEGTVSKWLKSVGDKIEKDEPLLEISTDKVDAEVPSPAGGTLLAINVQEGETVEVGSVLALVGAEGSSPVSSEQKAESSTPIGETPKAEASVVQAAAASATPHSALRTPHSNGGSNGNATVDDLRRQKSSPLVRNIAKEHGIDITRIPGSGISGRVTKNDILSFIETGGGASSTGLIGQGGTGNACCLF